MPGVVAPLRYNKAGLKIFLSLVILATGSYSVFAQEKLLEVKFMCHAERGTVPFLLRKVSAYSHTVIEYGAQYVEGGGIIELKEEETTLKDILNGLLAGKKVRIEERNGKIMLIPADIALAALKQPDEYVLFGYTKEEGSLEPLPYTTILNLESGQACQANMFGYYSLCITRGLHHIKIMRTGYPSLVKEVFIGGATRKNFTLSPAVLPEVKVIPEHTLPKDGGSAAEKYLSAAYNNFLGESDPVRSLYLMPGNIESQEMMGRLMVRGGDPEQSIFLLDGNQVFNPTHLLGEISIINEGSLKSIRQFKNDFPARFDDALSSVTEVNTKDGNMDKWSGQLNAGLLAVAAAVEGPLQKERTAMMASFRHSWSDPLLNRQDSNYRAGFYDIHFKVTHLFGCNDKVTLSGYLGRDRLQLRQTGGQYLQAWGNRLATVNWSHVAGPRIFMNTTLNVSNYHNLAGFRPVVTDGSTGLVRTLKAYSNYASIERYEAKTQFEVSASANMQFRFGGKISHMIIHPFDTNISSELQEEIESNEPMKPLPFTESVFFYENEFRPNRQLLIRPGIDFSTYTFMGYHNNALQPRLFLAYSIGRHHQLTFAYARTVQYLHQVTSPALGINKEQWVPSTASLRPAKNNMVNLGYNFTNDKGASLSADLYYRKMNNITNFVDNGVFSYNEESWEENITAGKGWSYGAELIAGKRMKKWQLQLSYTLAWSWRQFEEVNNGEKFRFRYDRRHNLNLAINFQPDKHWKIAMIWHFNTGDWIPGPEDDDNDSIRTWQSKPSYYNGRMPSSHRLNFNVNYYFATGKLKHKVSTGFYNIIRPDAGALPDAWNADNNNVSLYSDHRFTPVYYLSYRLNF